ncbi:DUF6520 family protein [Salinimicrobium sp. MT39]|uniref:DUF6520 family protein n=1 Tax=Salinimicrobium profundisediminis TaxID=2994553 RepID=A0A9X3CV72_9FLAO|nr:DUF6520 family protein [Salinimicrobium profundisediminis]MCX2837467.1 DUF6520 family protein [Salinimicrobium profundisediminis]
MKNLKILLPMLAFIFAIGMAFAIDHKEEPEVLALDYYKVGSTWYSVAEQDCGIGEFTCRIQFGANGTPHDLYENMGDKDPKPSGTPDIIVLP